MKIFLSWSGKQSLDLAHAFRDWLPSVFQSVVPFLSTKDIAAGEPWHEKLSKVLEDHDFGIVCLTQANLTAPYVMFESGALAKKLGQARLVPVLYDLSEGELVNHPLTQFQYVHLTPEGIWKLSESINSNLGERTLSNEILKRTFDKWLPDFWKKIAATFELSGVPKKKIDSDAALEEILSIVRGLARRQEPGPLTRAVTENYLANYLGKSAALESLSPAAFNKWRSTIIGEAVDEALRAQAAKRQSEAPDQKRKKD